MATANTKKIVRSARALAITAIEAELAKANNKSVMAYRTFLILSADAKAKNVKVSEHIASFDVKYPRKAKESIYASAAAINAMIASGDIAGASAALAKNAEREAKVKANLKTAAAKRKAEKASAVTVTTPANVEAAA